MCRSLMWLIKAISHTDFKKQIKNISSASFSKLLTIDVVQIPMTNRLKILFDKRNPFFAKGKRDKMTTLPIFEQVFFKCSVPNTLLPL